MNEWDEFIVEESKSVPDNSGNEWDEFIVEQSIPTPSSPTYDDIATLLGKSILSGVLSVADIPQALASLAEMGIMAPINALGGNVRPVIGSLKYPSEYIKEGAQDLLGVDLEPRPATSNRKMLSRGVQDVTGAVLGGGIGRLAKGALAAKVLGADQNLAALGALSGVTGATAESAKEIGINPHAAEIGSALLVPGAAKKASELISSFTNPNVEKKLSKLGLSPKDFNVEAFEAGKKAGIELPAEALSSSPALKRKIHSLKGDPHLYEEVQKPLLKAEDQTRNKLATVIDEIGLADTPEVRQMFESEYKQVGELLPKDSMVNVRPILNRANDILRKYRGVSLHSNPSLQALNSSAESIVNGWNPHHFREGPIFQPVQDVYTQLRVFNDSKKLWNTEGTASKSGKELRYATKNVLEKYGKKQNPEWYQAWRSVDDKYRPMKNRVEVENILDKTVNHDTNSLNFKALSKAINSPEKGKELERLVNKKQFKQLKDIGEASKHIARSQSNFSKMAPNDRSWLAKTIPTAIGGSAGYLFGHDPMSAIGGASLGGYLGPRVTNAIEQKFGQRTADALNDRSLLTEGYNLAKQAKSTPKSSSSFMNNLTKGLEGAAPYLPRAVLAAELEDEDRKSRIPTLRITRPNNYEEVYGKPFPTVGGR